jgi:hypothetical protein
MPVGGRGEGTIQLGKKHYFLRLPYRGARVGLYTGAARMSEIRGTVTWQSEDLNLGGIMDRIWYLPHTDANLKSEFESNFIITWSFSSTGNASRREATMVVTTKGVGSANSSASYIKSGCNPFVSASKDWNVGKIQKSL